MVLRLKTWESRSSPGLQKSEVSSVFEVIQKSFIPSFNVQQKTARARARAVFALCASRWSLRAKRAFYVRQCDHVIAGCRDAISTKRSRPPRRANGSLPSAQDDRARISLTASDESRSPRGDSIGPASTGGRASATQQSGACAEYDALPARSAARSIGCRSRRCSSASGVGTRDHRNSRSTSSSSTSVLQSQQRRVQGFVTLLWRTSC